MKIHLFDQPRSATRFVARRLACLVAERPNAVLGLATGGTMQPVYAELLSMARTQGISFAGIGSFNLDEYVGLAPDHPQSYWHFMREHLFDHIDADPGRLAIPHGNAPDPVAEALRYEDRIRRAGGIDLQLLGLGSNGHIGFNEPGASFSSRTRVETLAEETRRANARFFGKGEHVPSEAITMGIASIMEARSIVLLAIGSGKAAAVRAMIEGPVSEDCPASALRSHPDVTVVLDVAAASLLDARTTVTRHDDAGELHEVG
ncbi:glucosamine-6-phosphate deaminase (plasmid) [Rhizobium sp. ACO-34A]|nr:glucosamine-6-phosphate deaminase [Rhizobium sp. ACO-34A]ATN37303.1 glucosamine-6-phosphate deaminase [Rhizobium sp. ACO-34A]